MSVMKKKECRGIYIYKFITEYSAVALLKKDCKHQSHSLLLWCTFIQL